MITSLSEPAGLSRRDEPGGSPEWHLITGEYPPQPGGVSDYCRLVAAGLAACGDTVHVWCPPTSGETSDSQGVSVRRDLGRLGPCDLARVGRQMDRFPAPRRLLVQWVPHAFGCRSVNLAFCLWLWRRARFHGDEVQIMVHEPYLPFGGTWKQCAAAATHRLMTAVLWRAARRVWVSTPTWEVCWRPYALGRRVPCTWLPVPSTIAPAHDHGGAAAVRARYAPPGGSLIGHFGTYGPLIAEPLFRMAPLLLADRPEQALLLLGRGGEELRSRIAARHPDLAGRVHAPGEQVPGLLSLHMGACDLMVQPYPGGVDGRRTSVMVALAHGRAVVTTHGRFTEPVWAQRRAVALVPDSDPTALAERARRVLADPAEKERLAAAGRALYQDRFDLKHCIAALRTTN